MSLQTTAYIQNVAGTDSYIGFFFQAFVEGTFSNVQVGWYAQGAGVVDGLVIEVNPGNETIIITGSQKFKSGQSYSFTFARVTPDPPCFNKGTKILCLTKNFEEKYVPVEDLQSGDIVKTYLEGFRKIHIIGHGKFINDPERWQSCMFTLPKQNGMIDDLTLTGYHSILVDKEDVDAETSIPKYDKFLVCAGQSARFKKATDKNEYTYYHFCLESDGFPKRLFAVWANGMLAETTFAEQFMTDSLLD
jgi:hypothetical protein